MSNDLPIEICQKFTNKQCFPGPFPPKFNSQNCYWLEKINDKSVKNCHQINFTWRANFVNDTVCRTNFYCDGDWVKRWLSFLFDRFFSEFRKPDQTSDLRRGLLYKSFHIQGRKVMYPLSQKFKFKTSYFP